VSGSPDVVCIVLDSARKDRVSTCGHDRETTPALDSVASAATVYENAFVPAPWTLPSHCSMFTGRFPSEHGITNGFTDRNLELSTEFQTITELLSDRGYATAGFSNNPWVGKLSGLNRGFDRFVEWDLEVSRTEESSDQRLRDELYSTLHSVIGRAAGQPHVLLKRRFFTSNLVERAERWLVETADRPSFTFMNLMEAHSPYYPPKRSFRELGFAPPGPIESRLLNVRLLAYVMGKIELSAADRERVMEYYDASLRYQDEKLEDLLSTLRSRELFDDAMIVICADHGKTLGEWDRDATPPHYVRDVNSNVPLLIKWPNQRQGERVNEPVELVNLFDAIRDVEDAPGLARRTGGALVEDFVPHTGRSATDVVRWRVLADESQKYVRSDDGQEFLFERELGGDERPVDTDPAELGRHRDRLRDRVEALEIASSPTSEEAADNELGGAVEGQLRDLGYLE
jgi:choline-sulfatase